jgi:hypothetical protein
MKKNSFRMGVGLSVIVTHAICFFIIFTLKNDYLTKEQQIDIALLFMPITATYVAAVVRSAIDNSLPHEDADPVNLNYALVVLSISSLTLLGLIWTVSTLTGTAEPDRQRIIIFEIVFGTAFGAVASDLFGKTEKLSERTR